MYVMINEENKAKLDVYAEQNDLCFYCENLELCPLINSLQEEVAILKYDGVTVTDCGLFKEVDEAERYTREEEIRELEELGGMENDGS